MDTSTAASDGLVTAIGLNVALSVALPIMVLVIAIAAVVSMFALLIMTTRLRELSERLDDVNDNVMRGPLTKEQYSDLIQEERREEEAVRQISQTVMTATAGVIFGIASIITGSIYSGDSTIKYTLWAAGLSIIVVSIAIPLVKKSSTKS